MVEIQIFQHLQKYAEKLQLSQSFIDGLKRIYKKYRLFNICNHTNEILIRENYSDNTTFQKELKNRASLVQKDILIYTENALLPFLNSSTIGHIHALTQFVDVLDYMVLIEEETRIIMQKECYSAIQKITGEMTQVFNVYDKYIEKIFNLLKIKEE